MNRYLRSGGRLVGMLVFAAGIVLVAIGLWFINEALAHWGGDTLYGSRSWPVRWLEAGIICEAFAVACFRYCVKLRREERNGIQI